MKHVKDSGGLGRDCHVCCFGDDVREKESERYYGTLGGKGLSVLWVGVIEANKAQGERGRRRKMGGGGRE